MKKEDLGKNHYGGEDERLFHRGEDCPLPRSTSGNGGNFLTPDRIFQMVVSAITVLLAVAGAALSFSDKANSVVLHIRNDIASQNAEIQKVVTATQQMREDLDEHKAATSTSTETRARYHHTAVQLNCALCKGATSDHPTRHSTPRGYP